MIITDLQKRQIKFIGDQILAGRDYDLSKIQPQIRDEVEKYVSENQKDAE